MLTALHLRGRWLTPDRGRDLLVAGPSLGTAVSPLWEACAALLAERAGVDVLGWELPGHGGAPPVDEPFSLAELAGAVRSLADDVRPGAPFHHAGVSVAGATGLELALTAGAAGRLRGSAVICSGPQLGTAQSWSERAELVRRAGTPVMVEGSARRWFAPGFVADHPAVAGALLSSLQHADARSYARVCEALGAFDATPALAEVEVPVLVLGGVEDPVAPPQMQQDLHAALPGSSLALLDGVAHLAPAEAPDAVADALTTWIEETR